MIIRIHQHVLRFNVSMADTESMDVGKCLEKLIRVEPHKHHGNRLLHLVVVTDNPLHSLGNVVHDDIQVDFVFTFAFGVEGMIQSYDVPVVELPHNLQLSTLVVLVLVDLLDGHYLILAAFALSPGLVHDTERAVSNHPFSSIGELLSLLRFALRLVSRFSRRLSSFGTFIHFEFK